MNAILLYPEIPKGMKSYGPKAIIPLINNRGSFTPLIVQQIKKLKKTCNKIYIVVGFDKQKIVDIVNKYKINDIEYIEYNEYNNGNDGGSLKITFDNIDKHQNYLIVQGGVIPPPIKEPKHNTLFYLNDELIAEHNNFTIGIRVDSGCVASYLFYDAMSFIWTEMAFVTWESIELLVHLIKLNKIYSSMFLFECINTAIDNGIKFTVQGIKKNSNIIKINHYKQ